MKIVSKESQAFEVNFDGLVGPTHNYAGLSFGNVASTKSKLSASNPKEAALQGLNKMRRLSDMGVKQAILPPQERPYLKALRALGYSGSDNEIINQASKEDPYIFASANSASSMWTANAATVSPSADTADQKVHLTPANLANKFHRSFEHETTQRVLKNIFTDTSKFTIHDAIPNGINFGDEGAANHNRFCNSYGEAGVELFVFGKTTFASTRLAKFRPIKFPARQAFEASQAVARLHQLDPSKTILAQQSPHAIDLGVFHNDVISTCNENLYLYHELAFVNTKAVIKELQEKFEGDLHLIKISSDQLPVKDSVASYLFNSQIVSLPSEGEKSMALIAPIECHESKKVRELIDEIIAGNNPIKKVQYMDLKQSMSNGGGPACLRLRVALKTEELNAINQAVILTDDLYHQIKAWIEKHYREELSNEDLADPNLYQESKTALDELTKILQLDNIYDFQR